MDEIKKRGFGSGHASHTYRIVRTLGKAAVYQPVQTKRKLHAWLEVLLPRTLKGQWYSLVLLAVFVAGTVALELTPFIDSSKPYPLTEAARSVLPKRNEKLAEILKYNQEEGKYLYNEGYTGSGNSELSKTSQGDARFTASFSTDPTKGVTVTDPVNKTDFTMKPKFRLLPGKQDQNQVVYRLGKGSGYLVYTAQTASVKEDIVLEKPGQDRMEFEYELDLANGLEARLEKNGSVGIYGSDLPINGNVSTGSEKDAELLQKMRENGSKNKFLFGIPAPVVVESGNKQSSVSSYFELQGNQLKVVSTGLKNASYPLSIDPSVYIQSAAQLMRGNNESNVAFDVATEQFKKGSTTGARIDEWTPTGAMNDGAWDQGTAAAGGYVYRAGGRSGRNMPWIAGQQETVQTTVSTTFTMNMPSVRPAGDLYVAIIAHDGTTEVTEPAGWTEYANNNAGSGNTREHAAFYRVGTDQGGGNEAASYAFTGGNVEWAGVILRIKNFDSSDVVSGTPGRGFNGAAAVPIYPTTTPDTQGTLVVRAASFNDDLPTDYGYSPTSDHDDIASGHSGGTGTTDAGFVVSVLDQPPASGVATGTATLGDADISDTYGASSIAINGVTGSSTVQSSVQWAKFNSTNGSIDSPTPGPESGPCSNWCNNSAYNLPEGRVGMQLIAYNGYLYAMGGSDGTNLESTVWIAKLGINGEPSKWHPTDPNQATWDYWFVDTALSSARAYHGAFAYNGKMYIVGGDTDLSSPTNGAITTVQLADILPNGKLGSWSSGSALGTARYGAAVQAYNGYLYVLGGNNNSTILDQVHYSKLNSDGTMNSWQTAGVGGSTGVLPAATSSHGGVMSGIWGGYIYLAGGCGAVNGSGICTTFRHEVRLASINSDGTIDAWNTMSYLRHRRVGSSFIAWQNNLYRFGGCSRQDTTTGDCYGTHIGIQYGTINQDGDASTVSVTKADGVAPCVDPDPYDCDLPPIGDNAGQGGQMLSGTAILNGYLYVIGGCAALACNSGANVSGNVSYAAISSDGKLKRPPSCEHTQLGSWCVDSTNRVNSTTGVAAAGITVFGGHIYVVGGLNGGGNVANVFRNRTNSDGSLDGAWDSQTFANLGITQSVAYTFAYSRANPASAGTYPGNLYLFGGCGATSGAGCTGNDYRTEVWKCNILTSGALEETDANDCDTANQLQIDSDPDTGGNQGLGIHAGTVYANYIYLIGGLNGGADLDEVRYAKFDNSNNVVAVSGGAWVESAVKMNVGRRRGTAFGYNGYLYAVGGFEGTASRVIDTIEFVKLNVSDGSLISSNNLFNQSAVTISQRWGLGLAVSNSFAYVIGGCKAGISPDGCTSLDTTIQTFQVYNNDSGAPGGYTADSDKYTTNRIGAGVAIHNGYIYVAGGCTSTTDCTTATNSVQYASIDAYGNVGTWSAGNNLPATRAWGQLEVAGSTLYFLGGQDSTATDERSEVYYTTGFSTGNPTWSGTAASGGIGDTASQAAQPRTHFSSTVWNNRIYVVGGLDGSAAVTNTVYISPDLSSGGNIAADSWTAGTSINVARSGHVAIAYANNLYILGGYTGSQYLSDVQFTQINTDGTLDSWAYSTSLPMALRQADGFASNGYMYLFGGRSSTNDCQSRTLIAPISANTTIATGNNPTGIGEWYETNRRFDGGRYGAGAANYQGKAYVLGGGCQGVVMQDDFDATHDAGEWSNTTGMTAGTTCQSTSTSNVFYLTTGGTTNQAATKNVDVSSGGTVYFKLHMPSADIGGCFRGEQTGGLLPPTLQDNVEFEYSNNGGAWTQIGGDYVYNTLDPITTNAVTIPAGAFGANTKFRWIMREGEGSDSFAIEDVSIIATNSTVTSYAASSVNYTPLLSQPQVAIYSRLIDADRDVFPTVWLINGLDNSIGARWQMNYRSMNDPTATEFCGGSAMTGYGQATNYGNVTLGKPGAYTVKNSGGTNITCGRYFFMTVSIDASPTYGYPDDIERGPTLTDLTLFFKANPGKRLIHGKTFIEGLQQPLDTQCGISNPVDTDDVCPNP